MQTTNNNNHISSLWTRVSCDHMAMNSLLAHWFRIDWVPVALHPSLPLNGSRLLSSNQLSIFFCLPCSFHHCSFLFSWKNVTLSDRYPSARSWSGCADMAWDDDYPDTGQGMEWDWDTELDPWSAKPVSIRLFDPLLVVYPFSVSRCAFCCYTRLMQLLISCIPLFSRAFFAKLLHLSLGLSSFWYCGLAVAQQFASAFQHFTVILCCTSRILTSTTLYMFPQHFIKHIKLGVIIGVLPYSSLLCTIIAANSLHGSVYSLSRTLLSDVLYFHCINLSIQNTIQWLPSDLVEAEQSSSLMQLIVRFTFQFNPLYFNTRDYSKNGSNHNPQINKVLLANTSYPRWSRHKLRSAQKQWYLQPLWLLISTSGWLGGLSSSPG